MGASERIDRTSDDSQTQTLGQFPELTPVQWAFPNPFPRAGDITPRSEWTSSSTASIRGWSNSKVAANWETTVLAVTDRFESGETSMSVGGPKADTTSFLEGVGEIGLSAKGVDGGI